MRCFLSRLALIALALSAVPPAISALTQKTEKKKSESKAQPREIWNFDGGIYFETDGTAQEETCFRLNGHLTAPEFFDNLRRFDTAHGTEFRRGKEVVTEFPERLTLTFTVADFPCADQLKTIGARTYLTREMMSNMHVSFFWKHGITLRPVEQVTREVAQVVRVDPYNTKVADELPERFRWVFQIAIPSEGVPVTDSLVLIFRAKDNNRIAARVAARM